MPTWWPWTSHLYLEALSSISVKWGGQTQWSFRPLLSFIGCDSSCFFFFFFLNNVAWPWKKERILFSGRAERVKSSVRLRIFVKGWEKVWVQGHWSFIPGLTCGEGRWLTEGKPVCQNALKRVATWPAMGQRDRLKTNTPCREKQAHSATPNFQPGVRFHGSRGAQAHGSSPAHQFCALGKMT